MRYCRRNREAHVNKIFKATLPLAILGACAGRSPQPVAIVQPQDRYADCAAIIAEAQANNTKIQELAGDEGSKVAQNVAAGVVGVFIWPVLLRYGFPGRRRERSGRAAKSAAIPCCPGRAEKLRNSNLCACFETGDKSSDLYGPCIANYGPNGTHANHRFGIPASWFVAKSDSASLSKPGCRPHGTR